MLSGELKRADGRAHRAVGKVMLLERPCKLELLELAIGDRAEDRGEGLNCERAAASSGVVPRAHT